MNIEQQVVSLELAKKLKELGVAQESNTLFWWWKIVHLDGKEDFALNDSWIWKKCQIKSGEMLCAAFTVAELGEMIKEVQTKIDCGDVCSDLTFSSAFSVIEWNGDGHQEIANTEADARAKMLIYLLENNLINK